MLSVDDQQIYFTYKDYKQAGKKRVGCLSPTEFLRRFCFHVLPHGFVRMRHYGILASRNKLKELNIAREAHGLQPWQQVAVEWVEIAQTRLGIQPERCSVCNGELEFLYVILPQRAPPITQGNYA